MTTRRTHTTGALGVACDFTGTFGQSCDAVEADGAAQRFGADTVTRYGAVLDFATGAGWVVVGRESPLTARTFCPVHRLAARS